MTARVEGRMARFRALTHADIHPRPLAGCQLCPPTVCVCGVEGCESAAEHRAVEQSAEVAWRAA